MALDERRRHSGGKRPKPERGDALALAFNELQTAIEELTTLQRDAIQLDRAIAHANAILEWLNSAIQRLELALERDSNQLTLALQAYEDSDSALYRQLSRRQQRLHTTIDQLGQESCEWMDEFLVRFEHEFLPKLSQFSRTNLQKHFHFFFADTLSQALNSCVESHQPIIMAHIAELFGTEQISSDLGISMGDTQHYSATTFVPTVWNNLDTLHWVSSVVQPMLFGTVGKIVLAAAFAAVDQKFDDTQQVLEYQKQLRAALPELRISLRVEILHIYDRIATGLLEQLDKSFREDIAAASATLQQAQTIHAHGIQQVTSVRASCLAAREIIKSGQMALNHFEQRLWPVEIDKEPA